MVPKRSERPRHVAVVDLGSNSFHMLIARIGATGPEVVDKLREPVRLADGLGEDRMLDEAAQQRALECLARFAQRIASLEGAELRVLGTNTLRKARNGKQFRKRAAEVLGYPVEVISGDEEARLIYQGVASSRSDPGRSRLVVDIGGGSTEAIVGRDKEVLHTSSMFMGCVGYSRRYFADGALTREAFRAAQTAAALELRAIERRLRQHPFELALGSSGTINAIHTICQQDGLADSRIDRRALKRLRKQVIACGHVDRLQLPGLREDRVPVLAGGLAILVAVFQELGLESMEPAGGALREGVLADFLGELEHRDIRVASVDALARRFAVDQAQADRVARTARAVAGPLGWLEGDDAFDPGEFLGWAARLHELGLALRYTGHHRHGAYLVANSQLPGFSRDGQVLLAGLVLNHRRRLQLSAFDELGGPYHEHALRLCLALRLAVLLNRSRSLAGPPEVRLVNGGYAKLSLEFAPGWLRHHPLTRADLEEEAGYLAAAGVELRFTDSKG